jgi:hypothetical protein
MPRKNNLTHIYETVVYVSGTSIFLENDVVIALPRDADQTVRNVQVGDHVLCELSLLGKPYTVAVHAFRIGRHIHTFFVGTKDKSRAQIRIRNMIVHHDL